jgi:hypothetical protein
MLIAKFPSSIVWIASFGGCASHGDRDYQKWRFCISIFASDVSDKCHGTRNAIFPGICLISDILHLEVRAYSADACSHSGPRGESTQENMQPTTYAPYHYRTRMELYYCRRYKSPDSR